jgi:tetraacyldisaccharide 4'-kinase
VIKMREPGFWWQDDGAAARILGPLATIYGLAARARLAGRGQRAGVPVVCIGNLTVGGAGKTPTCLAIAGLLQQAGELPVFLTRGYGGRLAGPVAVDPTRQRAADVGDEPLLLAQAAPTIVARARVAGAKAAVAAGASVVVMDDGFQNPALRKDFSVLVLDSRRGIGNGRVIPAGPLRAPVNAQLQRAHALLVIGKDPGSPKLAAQARALNMPVFAAQLKPDQAFIAAIGRGRVLAFAGIGDPQKFFATLEDAGIAVAMKRSFPDHHCYTGAQARSLCAEAKRDGLVLVTTQKDLARLFGDNELTELAAQVHALPITLSFEDEQSFKHLLLAKIAQARRQMTDDR